MLSGRVALVHDFLEQDGGAERVLESLHRMFPEAPIFTAVRNPRASSRFDGCAINTTWVQRIPGAVRAPRLFAALYPMVFAGLNLSGFKLVLSSASYFAKGVRVDRDAVHVCYCHSPSNFIWRANAYLGGRARRALTAPLRAWLLAWDRWGARQPDRFVANGQAVAERIRSYYGREAVVVPPPIGAQWFVAHQSEEFYLVVSRLVDQKRIQLAIEACGRLGVPLWIAGDGRAALRLHRQAGPTVRFLGRVSDRELTDLYARAIAVLLPAEEDFGLVPLEAQAAGTPVVAYDRGGARETVIDGVTGIRFQPQTADALATAITRAARQPWDRARIQAHAARFNEQRFQQSLMAVIEQAQRDIA